MHKIFLPVLVAAFGLSVVSLSAQPTSFDDAIGDIDAGIATGSGTLDIVSMEVSDNVDDVIFTLTVNGNITTTDWGNFFIGIANQKVPGSTTGNGWGRPINLNAGGGNGMTHWIGSWVSGGGGGSQLYSYSGTGWDGPASLAGFSFAAGTQSTITYTVSKASLGVATGDTIQFDAYSSGGGVGDSSVDALSNPNVAITSWEQNYTSQSPIISSYTLSLNSPRSLESAATKGPFNPATVANWSSGGVEWRIDYSTTYDGFDSAKAQTIDGESTYREYTVTGPAVVDFWWKVSSEQIYDKFTYSLNGVDQETISGEVDWTYRTLTLPAGAHAIRWTYSKDAADAVGQDAGWLDDFAVYPATPTLRVRDGSTVLDGTQTVDFGDADLGTAGFTKSLTFANEGYVPLEVELSLPEDSPFSFEDDSATHLLLLGRGESVDVPIQLSTQSSGIKTAVLTINAPDSTVAPPQITLTGDVPGPVVGVSLGGTTLTSGQTVDMGLAPKTLEFTIRNDGNIGDLLPQVSVTGNFQIVQQPAASVAPQGSTTFKVLAQSGAFGQQTGAITILSNDGVTPAFSLVLNSSVFFSTTNGFANEDTATFGTGGAAGWNFASTQLPGGSTGRAIKTGATPNSGSSVVEMMTQSAGVVSWSWKVSAQENFDWLLCEVNGQEVAGISTKSGAWQTQVVQVPAGAKVRWVYRKDSSASAGEDAGYLADVAFNPMTGSLFFGQWGAINGLTDPKALLPKSAMSAMFAWLGGVDPWGGPEKGHYKPTMEAGRLKYRVPISKTAEGIQRIQFSSDLLGWTSRGMSQRIVSEDGNRMVVEATAPAGAKGFFRVLGSGDTTFSGLLTVQGGTLPHASSPAGIVVATHEIGQHEVTWDEWQEVRAWAVGNGYSDLANVGAGSAGDHPVHSVSWHDVVKWCNAKSEKEGLVPVYWGGGVVYRTWVGAPSVRADANGYRLPTEAEWEWAARGGLASQGFNYSGSSDVSAIAWYYENSSGAAVNMQGGRGTWPVGQKAANELGLHDMSGNVWEWCEGVGRLRGGSWGSDAGLAAVAFQGLDISPLARDFYVGFRLARSLGL